MGAWFDYYLNQSGAATSKAWRYLVGRSDVRGITSRGSVLDDTVTDLERMTLLIQLDNGDLWLNPTHTGKGTAETHVERVSAWDEAFVSKARKALRLKNRGMV